MAYSHYQQALMGQDKGWWMWGGQDVANKASFSKVLLARLQTCLPHQWCS